MTPVCGTASSTKSVNFNSGISLDAISTLYVFGDSLSATGDHRGGTAPPAVPNPNTALHGGRASNGQMWNEVLLTKSGAKVASFAIGGAVIDRTLYKSVKPTVSDMPTQVQNYLDKKIKIDPESSLTAVYFGTNDYGAAMKDKTAERPPISRDAFLEHNKIIWDGMLKYQKSDNIKFARVEMGDLFKKIADDPKSFGFVDNKNCLTSMKTTEGGCSNPRLHPFWFSGHPAAETQKMVAQYVNLVLKNCGSSNVSSAERTKRKS
ncbi:uncharacterized protein MELLADRAFT_66126 [Melampsora larici-populina 98AG31]|uniref:Carbohydrate esterase family 16 protein n=1 Tax=Melampsora larici-populina (strain 98AG31 / pathotype 3-4-7) TaxID=747676 RepID=F4RXZ4_MELLP|nr:uncharacterized protein MELLADRAFT_66126 [Melampsora larici-populina 98AG31]EGG02596.1 hypothetical protein MELLADRAFT_66126 [Melampsora larici-populina 98AG31]